MDPITLHFNVFQAGASQQGRHSLQVEDPRRQTVGALKNQLFGEALEARRSVRFIASGKVLEDSVSLDTYNLGPETHICVSISDRSLANDASSSTRRSAQVPDRQAEEPASSQLPDVGMWSMLAGLLTVAGAALPYVVQRHRQLSNNMHLMLFVGLAVWLYVALFHVLPDGVQLLLAALRWSLRRREGPLATGHSVSSSRKDDAEPDLPVSPADVAAVLPRRKPATIELD